MKTQVRRGVFETNSSSTHSITMMMKEDYDKWYASEDFYLFNSKWVSAFPEDFRPQYGELYTKEEVIAFLKASDKKYGYEIKNYEDEDIFYDERRECGFILAGEENDEYLEGYYEEFTTPNEETVVAFGKYGYDG